MAPASRSNSTARNPGPPGASPRTTRGTSTNWSCPERRCHRGAIRQNLDRCLCVAVASLLGRQAGGLEHLQEALVVAGVSIHLGSRLMLDLEVTVLPAQGQFYADTGRAG